jgi:glutaminyl-peptide cyclotransferase
LSGVTNRRRSSWAWRRGEVALRSVALGVGTLITAAALLGCAPPADDPAVATFQGSESYRWVIEQCDLGYRIPGTEVHRKAGDLIVDRLNGLGWQVREQEFPYMGITARNILAWKGEGPAILVGAHYDTRGAADQEDPAVPVMGANDGASGVAVLLELARVLDVDSAPGRVYLAFFDVEDGGRLGGWEWIVGSTYMAEHWGEAGETPLQAVVVADMIGDQDLQVFYEHNSDPGLSAQIWRVAGDLGYADRVIPQYRHAILDDHLPFLQLGIPAVDLIDFDYPYWHTTQDTPDKVSSESLETIGRTLEAWLEGQ